MKVPHTEIDVQAVDDPDQWADVACDPDVDPADLTWIAAMTEDPDILRALIENPATPCPTVEAVVSDYIRVADPVDVFAWSFEITNPRAIAVAYDVGDRDVWLNLARNPATPGDILRSLARSDDEMIRFNVARHEQAPGDVLGRLAAEDDIPIAGAALSNARCPVGVLVEMSHRDERLLRERVACHPATPVETLVEMARAGDAFLREIVREQLASRRRGEMAEEIRRVLRRRSRTRQETQP